MSQREQRAYAFADALPLNPIEPGTNLFLAGPSMSDVESVGLRLVLPPAGGEEGTLLVSTDTSGADFLDRCADSTADVDPSRLGIVDATGQGEAGDDSAARIETVATPSDLTGIGIGFSALYEAFYEDGIGRVRTGCFSVSTLLMYSEVRTVFRFLHTLAGRISAAEGIGVFLIDPTTQDERTVNTIGQLCDGRIEVREAEDGTAELRVRGLDDQPREWTPLG